MTLEAILTALVAHFGKYQCEDAKPVRAAVQAATAGAGVDQLAVARSLLTQTSQCSFCEVNRPVALV
jgi:hypothetical protein